MKSRSTGGEPSINSRPVFSLRLLGSPSIARDAGALLGGPAAQRHRLALLALLALSPGRGVSREKLMAYLWPERDTERARQLLNQAVYNLRKALGEEALLSDGDDLRLNPEVIHTDVAEFESALERADHAHAVALYRRPFLEGFFLSEAPEFEQWADRERERLAGGYRKSLEALGEEAEAERDFSGAAEWWKMRAAQDPYDSRTAVRLMQALEASGNRAGALRHAAMHQRLLEEEFGMAAAPEITALAERLRREPAGTSPTVSRRAESLREPSLESPAPPGAAPEVSAPGESSPTLPTDPIPAAAIERTTGRRPRWLGAAALVAVVLVVAAIWAVWPRASGPERSIAVLPFVNLSQGDDEYFSDGLTEEIITRLSAVPELKVISRSSAMYFKGGQKPLRQIAAELKIAHVLQGSVRQSGGRVRISAQLVDARADGQIWAETYDRDLQDIFRVQEEIAREVARALELKLGKGERRLLAKQGTDNPEAYELYRRGRFLWHMRTREGHERAIAYYRRALERDSNYADAYAAMANAYYTAFQLGFSTMPDSEVLSRVQWAAERALALDERCADAHAAFAMALRWQRNWPGAERELRRAIELNPGDATTRSWYSVLLAGMGRREEAMRESRQAYELDPFGLAVSSRHAWNWFLAREYDRAIEEYRRSLEIDPSWTSAYQGLALAYAQKRMHGEALRAIRKAIELRPDQSIILADLAYVQAMAEEKSAARSTLQRATRKALEPFAVARAYVALGEPDSAFAWLERSNWQWPHRANLHDPTLDPLRSDPRFARLAARVGREMGIQ